MAKVQQAIYFDIKDFEALEEIRIMCKHKNLSQTIGFLLKRYRKLEEEQRTLRSQLRIAAETGRKPINPMVNP